MIKSHVKGHIWWTESYTRDHFTLNLLNSPKARLINFIWNVQVSKILYITIQAIVFKILNSSENVKQLNRAHEISGLIWFKRENVVSSCLVQILSGAFWVITCYLTMSPKSNQVFIMLQCYIHSNLVPICPISCTQESVTLSQQDSHEKQTNNMPLFPLLGWVCVCVWGGGGGGGHKKNKECLISKILTDWLPATICGVEDCDWPGSLDSLPHEHFTCCSIITCPCTPHIACAACSLLPNLKISPNKIIIINDWAQNC